MNGKVYLLSLTMAGIKSIRDQLRLEFYKKTVNKSFDPSNHRIKAIYGENGCGKTAVITAAQILKDLICDRSCLDAAAYQEFLSDVINLHDQKLHLECEFYHYTEPADQVYHYTIELSRDTGGNYRISYEELTYRKADYPASKVSIAYSLSEEAASDGSEHKTVLQELGKSLRTNIETPSERKVSFEGGYDRDDLEMLTRFVKVFKPDIKNIIAAGSNDMAAMLSDLILDYGDSRIKLRLESSGIRSLINLWPCLKASNDAGIVFIDGFDRDINEIYFNRLIRYYTQYGEGQLCFTLNNTEPMQELRKYKNSIDFLSSDGKVTHWRTSGNFSPDSLYKNGMIENLPFNIEPEDFLGLL